MVRFLATLIVSLGLATQAHAGLVNLGVLSFSTLIPANPPDPGVNAFSISNFTGDPGSGGFALPPDFNVFTPVTFLNSTLTIVIGGVSQDISLGDLAPGSYNPSSLEFSSDTLFDSATFTATLDTTSLTLDDASTVTALTDQLSITLSPTLTGTLTADIDLAIITAETIDPTTTDVPEPAPALLTAAAALAIALRRSRR